MNAYLTRLICGAILCALVDAISGNRGGIRKLTAGIFLTLVAFSLPVDFELPNLKPDAFFSEARSVAAEGEGLARDAREEIIIGACEAYVWNKAESMGLEVAVQIDLDEDLHPCGAVLTGEGSPLERQTLCDILTKELGLKEGEVVWDPLHQSSE